MKRLLYILIFVCSVSYGQVGIMGGGVSAAADHDSVSWIAYYKTYYYSITEANRPGIDTAIWQNDLFYSVDSAGIKDSLLTWHILYNKSEEAALTNAVNPGTHDGTASGAPAFTIYRGYEFDGTDYVNSNWNVTDDGGSVAGEDDFLLAYDVLEDVDELSSDYGGGNGWASAGTVEPTTQFGSTMYIRYHSANYSSFSNDNSIGQYHIVRDAANSYHVYKNGSQSVHGTDNSDGTNADDLFIGGYNDDGALTNGSSRQIGMGATGGKISPEKVAAFDDIIDLYKTRIGL